MIQRLFVQFILRTIHEIQISCFFSFQCGSPTERQGDKKLVCRLIQLFSSTEIFSKRRKICACWRKTRVKSGRTSWAYNEWDAKSHVVQIISISSFKALAHWIHVKYFNKQGRKYNGRVLNAFILEVEFSFSFGKHKLTVCVVPTTTAIAAKGIQQCACVFIFFSFPFKTRCVRQ